MTDHQIVLAGIWLCTAMCWVSNRVSGLVSIAMTGMALCISYC